MFLYNLGTKRVICKKRLRTTVLYYYIFTQSNLFRNIYLKITQPWSKLNTIITTAVLPGGPFNLLTPDLTSYQQQLWLSAQLITKVATEQETFTKVCFVSLHVKGISGQNTVSIIGDRIHNRTRTIRCTFNICINSFNSY